MGSGLVWTRAKRKEGRWEKVEVRRSVVVVKLRFLTKRVAPWAAEARVSEVVAAAEEEEESRLGVMTDDEATGAGAGGGGGASLNIPAGPFSR